MNYLRFTLLFLVFCSAGFAVESELATLDDLIAATQKSLQQQTELRELLQKYMLLRTQCIEEADNTDALYQATKTAYRAMNLIQEGHLEPNFEPEFLSELRLFAQVGNKKGIPKP